MAELTNKFDCHICLHYFTNPKIIDCFHSFCKSCLEDYVRKYVTAGEFPCPLCRKSIRVPFGGVDKFPCNFNLCIDEDDKEISSFSSCQQHKKERDLYCSLCNIAICTKCLTSSHQGHLLRNVEDIEEETREDLEFFHANLNERLIELKTLRSNIKKEKKKLRPSLQAYIYKVDKQKEQIYQHVENEGMEIKSELEASCKKRELSLSQLKRDADGAIKKLEFLAKETPSVWLKDRLEEMMTMIPDVREKMAQVKRLKLPEDALCLVFKEGEIEKGSLSGMLGQLQNDNSTGSDIQKNRTSVIGTISKKEMQTKAKGDQERNYSQNSYAKKKNTCRDRFEHTFDAKNNQGITQASQLYVVKGVSWFIKAFFQNKNKQPKHNLPSTITLCLFDAQDSTYKTTFILKVINRLDESLSLKIKASFSFSSWYPYFHWKLAKDFLYPWTNDIEYLNSKDQLVVEAQITSLVKITGHEDFPSELASNCLDDYHMFSVDDDEDGDGIDYDTSISRAEDNLWYEEDGTYNDEYSDESDFDIHYSSHDEQDTDSLHGGASVDASGDLKSIGDSGTDDSIGDTSGRNNAVSSYKKRDSDGHNDKNINKIAGDHEVCGAEDVEGVSEDDKRNSNRDSVVHKRVRVGDHYKGSGAQKKVRTYDQDRGAGDHKRNFRNDQQEQSLSIRNDHSLGEL